MIFFAFLLGLLIGLLVSVVFFLMTTSRPLPVLHDSGPQTAPLPVVQLPVATNLPTGALWADWNARHAEKKEDESWLL